VQASLPAVFLLRWNSSIRTAGPGLLFAAATIWMFTLMFIRMFTRMFTVVGWLTRNAVLASRP
jgi:hypothetical protein